MARVEDQVRRVNSMLNLKLENQVRPVNLQPGRLSPLRGKVLRARARPKEEQVEREAR